MPLNWASSREELFLTNIGVTIGSSMSPFSIVESLSLSMSSLWQEVTWLSDDTFFLLLLAGGALRDADSEGVSCRDMICRLVSRSCWSCSIVRMWSPRTVAMSSDVIVSPFLASLVASCFSDASKIWIKQSQDKQWVCMPTWLKVLSLVEQPQFWTQSVASPRTPHL